MIIFFRFIILANAAVKPLITIAVDESYPFNIVVGLANVKRWEELNLSTFYINLKDGSNQEGNVTVTVSKSACTKSEETDKEYWNKDMCYTEKLVRYTKNSSHIPYL